MLYIIYNYYIFLCVFINKNKEGINYMELLENHNYSTEDMYNFFGVSKSNWKKNKDKFLVHLQQYYEYEITYNEHDRRKHNYHIIKKIKEYEPPKSKKEIKNEIYINQIINVIEKDNLQTAKNVSRIISNNKEIKELNHAESTIYEYTRVNMRTMFGKKVGDFGTKGIINNKIWCFLDKKYNVYIPIEKEKIEFLYDTFKFLKKENSLESLSIYADYDSGLITKEEMQEIANDIGLMCFIEAKRQFEIKYDYSPVKVPEYELSAF